MDIFFQTAPLAYEVPFLVWDWFFLIAYMLGHLVFFSVRIRQFFQRKKALVAKVEESDKRLSEILIAEETPKTSRDIGVSPADKQRVLECIMTAKVLIGRGELNDAKTLIIEGLSIDKQHRELNLILGSIYELERDYKKAEIIYKDLLVLRLDDIEIYLKLGFVLSIQEKYAIAYEIYEKLLSLQEGHIEAVEMLANIAHKLSRFTESIAYARTFLKKHPLHTDMLYLLAANYVNIEDRRHALETFEKIRSIEPYNATILGLIEKTKIELEMEAHFHDS